MKQFLYILTLLLIIPEMTFAQPKPKRDTSQDQSVAVARQKEEQARQAALAARRKNKRRTTTQNNSQIKAKTPIEYKATYLKIDQSTSVSKMLAAKEGMATFEVETDGKDWNVGALPSWCRFGCSYVSYDPSHKRSRKFFRIEYDANPTHDSRQGRFDVISGEQNVRVTITQQGIPLNVQAGFANAYLEHNVYVSSLGNCIKVTVTVTISGAAGQACSVVAMIRTDLGSYVKTDTGSNVGYSHKVTPKTDEAETFTIIEYIPNSKMKLRRKKQELECDLCVYCTNTFVQCTPYTIPFKAKSKRGVVTTSPSKKPSYYRTNIVSSTRL